MAGMDGAWRILGSPDVDDALSKSSVRLCSPITEHGLLDTGCVRATWPLVRPRPERRCVLLPWARDEHRREALALYVELTELLRRLCLDPEAAEHVPPDLARRLTAYGQDEMLKVRAELRALLSRH